MAYMLDQVRRINRNIRGSRVKGRYLVLESDDWGTIRMAGPDVYQTLLRKGYPVDQDCYTRNDALECNSDLEGLMDVLNSVRDANGRPAVMTVNNIVANPDFQKIEESGYQQYHYECFTETLKKYPCHDQVMTLYRDGIGAGLFAPQFHGREHVHVNNWLQALQGNDRSMREVFPHRIFSVNKPGSRGFSALYLDAMGCYSRDDHAFVTKSVEEGLNLFEQLWGFRSATLIAPCYVWNSSLHSTFRKNGIKMLQSCRLQKDPKGSLADGYHDRYVTMGQKANDGLRYLMRNAAFEPSTRENIDWVDRCMADIKMAFAWQKPAIVSTHRLNFIGWLNAGNRSRNLTGLKQLLQRVRKLYPDVQFLSSDQLVQVLEENG